jgi:thiamine biosynthesis lipoprotein
MKKLINILLILVLSLLAGCGDDQERARQAKFYAYGTEIDVSLFGVDETKAKSTIDALEAAFNAVDDRWHAWKPSTLTDINDAIAAGDKIAVTNDVASVIKQATDLAEKSNNLFNPAAGKLFELWGYHQDDWFVSRPPPPQTKIDAWLAAAPKMTDVIIENGVLYSDNTHVKIGFGGFAKGFAVDRAIKALQEMGITNAIVNIGGDLRAIGSHGERPWLIGIRHPRKQGLLASVELKGDESVFTSGDYERFFTYEGKRYPHIMDPRTGYPADQATSATVLHDNAAEADAAATALFVAGKDWPQVAARMGLKHVMLVRPDGVIELSPAMQKRVRILDKQFPPVIREIPAH